MQTIQGLASTSHIDSQSERFTSECLEDMARQINSTYLPLDIEHKGLFIGVLFCACVKQLKDGEWGLFVVGGIYTNNEDSTKYQIGSSNRVAEQYMHLIEPYELKIEVTEHLKSELIGFLNKNEIDVPDTFKKSLDTETTLAIINVTVGSISAIVNVFQLVKSFYQSKPQQSNTKLEVKNMKRGTSIQLETDQPVDIDSILEKFTF